MYLQAACFCRAPSLRHVSSFLTSSPVTSTSRNKEQKSTCPSSHLSEVNCFSFSWNDEVAVTFCLSLLSQISLSRFDSQLWVSAEMDLKSVFFSSGGRITEEELQAHVNPQRTLCYLCGPPPMIEAVSKTLTDLGLSKDRILFEKWW